MSELVDKVGLPVDEFSDPVVVREEDFSDLEVIQSLNEQLLHVRQELGRLHQVMDNLCSKAHDVERTLSEKRRALTAKYNLERGPGQWAVDFEKKEFVKVSPGSPVIP